MTGKRRPKRGSPVRQGAGHGRTAPLVAALALLVAGCGGQSLAPAPVDIRGSTPTTAPADRPSTKPVVAADPRGIVAYEGYEAAVAREGDTVATVAARVGLSASELAAYNGLPPDYALRPGDELVLPPRPDRYGVERPAAGAGPTAQPALDAGSSAAAEPSIEAQPLGDGGEREAAAAAGEPAEWDPAIVAAAIERAQAGGSLPPPPSAAEPLPPAPTAPRPLASPKLDQYQTVAPSPAPAPPPARIAAAPSAETQPGATDEQKSAATSAASTPPEPPPPAPATAPVTAPAAAPERTAAAPAPAAEAGPPRLLRPVEGPIVVRFNQRAGGATSEGVDFAAPANAPVRAAADGEVVLVSPALGGLGTIVLIRHPGGYLTVYGRIERVSVSKGDKVRQGQQIGVVSPAIKPRMHFELRKGTESLDPERFFI